jgi:hypothetical protein
MRVGHGRKEDKEFHAMVFEMREGNEEAREAKETKKNTPAHVSLRRARDPARGEGGRAGLLNDTGLQTVLRLNLVGLQDVCVFTCVVVCCFKGIHRLAGS